MERAASLMKGTRPLALLGVLCGLCGVAYSCAASQPVVRAPSRAPGKVSAVGAPAAGSAASSAAPVPLSLEGFRPLLSDARYDAARLKQEAGDYAAAADLVRAGLAKSPPPPSELDRHRFLLARLLERAGRSAEARDAFLTLS